nr:MAG TPA: hypothetical protein [Caudoviricetes sp.]
MKNIFIKLVYQKLLCTILSYKHIPHSGSIWNISRSFIFFYLILFIFFCFNI